jgi:hypothetical protein
MKDLELHYYLACERERKRNPEFVTEAFPKMEPKVPSKDLLDSFAYSIMDKFSLQAKKVMETRAAKVLSLDENKKAIAKAACGMIEQLFAVTDNDTGIIVAIVAESRKDRHFADPSKTVAVAMLKVVRDRLARLKRDMPIAVTVDNCQIFAGWVTLGLVRILICVAFGELCLVIEDGWHAMQRWGVHIHDGWENPLAELFRNEYFVAMGSSGDIHAIFSKYRDLGLFKNNVAAGDLQERMLALQADGKFDKSLKGTRDGSSGSR